MPKRPEIFIHSIAPGQDPQVAMQQILHDCPECRAAMERGEQPMFGGPPIARKPKPFGRPPRWRTRKQRRSPG